MEINFNLSKAVEKLVSAEKFDWANWLLSRLMDKKQCVRYVIYAAKQVLSIFEEKYPEDKRPREAIKALERWLKNPTEKNRISADATANAAYAAADFAADAAAYTTADAAAYATYATYVANAAYAAAYVAYVVNAVDVAADAVDVTVDAVDVTVDAVDVTVDAVMKKKIISYGLRIIRGE